MWRGKSWWLAGMFLPLYLAGVAQAQTLTTLYSFRGQIAGDGANPGGNLAMDSRGVLYGTTASGGVYPPDLHCSELGCGTVYSLTPPATTGGAWTESLLWSFGGKAGDGSAPSGGVILGKGGVLFGTTSYGGLGSGFGLGTVFSLTPPAATGKPWTETLLWTFGGTTSDGANPVGGVVMASNGVLYGTASTGGTSGGGVVFSLNPPGTAGGAWKETILWSFGSTPGDGYYPTSVAIGAGGVLYGNTSAGGSASLGTVFSLTPPAVPGGPWREAVIYSFSMAAEGYPTGLAMAGNGVMYGSTSGNFSTNGGTVFSLTPSSTSGAAWTESRLFSFPLHSSAARYGYYPSGSLLIPRSGVLTGTAEYGGAGNSGTVFRLTPVTGGPWQIKILQNFNGSDGSLPFSGLVHDSGSVLYGTCGSGGPGGAGTVFSL